MMGFIMGAINPLFLEDIIPAMIIFGVLAATLLGIPDPLVNARENGIFRSYKINGVPSFSILVIPAITTILHLLIMAVIITVTAPLLFNSLLPANWVNFVLVFLSQLIRLCRNQCINRCYFSQFKNDSTLFSTYFCSFDDTGWLNAPI